MLKKVLTLDSDVPATPSKNLRKRKRRTTGIQEGGNEGDTRAKTLDCILLHIVAMGAPPYIQFALLKALIDVDEKVCECIVDIVCILLCCIMANQ